MSFVMSYTDQGGTVHPESFWVLHAINLNRVTRHALLTFHGWHQWQDYPDERTIIGEHTYTITNPDDYTEYIAKGDESATTPYFFSLEGAASNLDAFFTSYTHYADSVPSLLNIDRLGATLPELHGPDAVLVQFTGEVDLPGNNLARGLVASWKLDDATGTTRVDALGRTANDLTDHNGIHNDTGKVGDCAQFTKTSSQYLSCDLNADLQITADGTHILACWVKFDDVFGAPIARLFRAGTSVGFILEQNSSSNIQFTVGDETDPENPVGATTSSEYTILPDEWFFIFCGYLPATTQAFISVNGEPLVYATLSGGGLAIEPSAGFAVGFDGDATFFGGSIDALHKYHFAESMADVDLDALAAGLYNSDAGWEVGMTDDWRTGVTLLVNDSPVTLISATSNVGSSVVWYKVASSFTSSDIVTWEYDAVSASGIIQNVSAGASVGPVIATSVDNQVGEYWIFDGAQASTWLAIDF